MNEKIEIGQEFKTSFKFSQEDVIAFANLTGDNNPVHLDSEFAATTRFKVPIIHGHLSSSIFTKFLGTQKPGGPGSIYLKQITEYVRPMTVETEYEAVFKLLFIDHERHIAEISTEVLDVSKNKVTIKGVATLMNEFNF